MDVTRVQKINKLVDDLLKQGMFSSREEAVKEAERMLGKLGKEEIEIKEMEPTNQPSVQGAVSGEGVVRGAVSGMDWKEAMTKNTRFLVGQIKDFREQLEGMWREICELREKIRRLDKGMKKGGEGEEGERQKVLEVKEEKKEAHPKRGKFEEEDVSIEKFFYYGKK